MQRTHTHLFLFSVFILNMITFHTAQGKFSFKKVSSWFATQQNEEILEKAYDIEEGKKLRVENIDGNITIKTDPNQVTIALRAIKRTAQAEQLEAITIVSEYNNNNLVLKTEYTAEIVGAQVDYELSVPAQTKLHLITQKGKITIDEAYSPIVATTTQGDITVANTHDAVKLETKETGAVHIAHAAGNVYATTTNGAIIIDKAYKNVVAQAEKGNILLNCMEVPAKSTIRLNTNAGTIQLALPTETNARLKGKTERGTLVSDHYITLNEQTTQLNRKAWTRFKKEVNGMLGSGEAQIEVHTANGNVKIKETKTA
ncbi:MAG TPA: DUF4097 family beta strand repeat-containing protein [Candidatus Dependentiae bacterium]|nr:DUF4097 family beta strand repeat-containing protein [Candidatus Dependentiae bacterium]HRQ62611.1 DUF4097 family beta strand repeat-containing protein [Candidatus Dependentiae bacterium]